MSQEKNQIYQRELEMLKERTSRNYKCKILFILALFLPTAFLSMLLFTILRSKVCFTPYYMKPFQILFVGIGVGAVIETTQYMLIYGHEIGSNIESIRSELNEQGKIVSFQSGKDLENFKLNYYLNRYDKI